MHRFAARHWILAALLTILFDGLAYGMLLFILACGLSVTLGLMNFVNLAHGAFAMAGGYVCVLLTRHAHVSFVLTLPIAFAAMAAAGLVLERLAYRRLYGRSHLDQVLFSIGLVFMASSAASYCLGSGKQLVDLPDWLSRRIDFGPASLSTYRLLIAVTCGVIALGLHLLVSRTQFGARLRAAVDNPQVAAGLGINVGQIFAVTFALGCGLAGLGGAMSAALLGVDPGFPVEYMVYFLIVVTVGGSGNLGGALCAALLLGISDVAGKRYLPEAGAFIIYAVMVGVLIIRPNGLFAGAGGR